MKAEIYKCPNCGDHLIVSGSSLCCIKKHNFDISKEGYVNLLTSGQKSSRNPGDNKLSATSRRDFLNAGYYDILANRLGELVTKFLPSNSSGSINLLDIGCGEGFFLSKIALSLLSPNSASFWGIDISKQAIQIASKRNSSINFAVGNVFSLPYLDGSVDIALSIFAPLDSVEASRVLKRDGYLISVVPGKNHLSGFVKQVYDAPQPHRDDKDPIKGNKSFSLIYSEEISDSISLMDKGTISNLLAMTPYFWQISLDKKLELEKLVSLTTDIAFKILLYRHKA